MIEECLELTFGRSGGKETTRMYEACLDRQLAAQRVTNARGARTCERTKSAGSQAGRSGRTFSLASEAQMFWRRGTNVGADD
jgi:hypothetical protein